MKRVYCYDALQMSAQCNTFTLAGYETTANAIAYCIYCLATHPAAEQKLIDEVDAAPEVDAVLDSKALENQVHDTGCVFVLTTRCFMCTCPDVIQAGLYWGSLWSYYILACGILNKGSEGLVSKC